jgi:two-component system, chemotaxis family, chemotaxis protein CheY
MSYLFRNITVLVVESNKAMFDLTQAVLVAFGVNQVYSAFGMKEGFEAFCRVNPDLVIIDWLEDPDNGLELTKKIRKDEQSPNPFTPIVLMTGYSQKKRVIQARDSGITEFLVKPFTAKALYQKIEQLIERPRHFVRSDNYFGPDRRRKREEYQGPERRTPDQPQPRLVTEVSISTALQKAKEIQRRRKQEGEDDLKMEEG